MTKKQLDYLKRIQAYAIAEGMPQLTAELISFHAFVETSGFKSQIFKEANNVFSYKHKPDNYLQLDEPIAVCYARYAQLKVSVKEICNLIKRLANDGEFPIMLDVKNTAQYIYALEPKLGLMARCFDFEVRMLKVRQEFVIYEIKQNAVPN